METFVKSYPNGLRLVVTPMQNYQSVAFRMLIMAGSGDEQPNEQGLSHFCEHMLFKGTKRRTGQQIIDELSMLGVDYNAWTSESATCYHSKCVADNLEACVDIYADMYFNLQFTATDFDKEGDVIVQEIAMHEDDPQSVLYDQLNATYFRGTKYEHPVAGFSKAIKKYQPDDIYHYIQKHYLAQNTIIAFAGDITVARAEALVAKYFLPFYSQVPAQPKLWPDVLAIQPAPMQIKKHKDTEQQHVALAFPICNHYHQDRYALRMFGIIFGGDMSSRLFINVREKLGLVYSIHAGLELSDIGGYLMVVFSCTPKNTAQVMKVIKQEIDKLLTAGITDEELNKARNCWRMRKMFDSENTVSVNARGGNDVALYNKVLPFADELAAINNLTKQDIDAVIKKYLRIDQMTTVTVGK